MLLRNLALALVASILVSPLAAQTPDLSRHPVALGVPADHRRISAEDDARELRALREVSALRLQLQRRQPLPHDQGVLPGRLRAAARVGPRRTLVSGRLVD